MGSRKKSKFQRAALASGLVSNEELGEALSALCLDDRAPDTAGTPDDAALAAKLVEMGKLNRWQATHLAAGRSKFTLKDYRILDSIGRGGMAEVYKAEHGIMRRVVALKVLPRAKSTPGAIASFAREIQAQAQLDHENLVRAFDAGHDGNVHFLVTEFVPGTDLRRHIKKHRRLTQRASAAIICQAAKGLEHAHSRGLIHRDVKPGNLLITPDGHVKVSDLGLAGYLKTEDEDVRDIHDGKIVGTADYLAPEQITAPDTLSATSDIYSLGCTLYYAVTGKVPFPGGTARDKAKAHCKQQPITPRRYNPELTDEFIEVIYQMMVKDPKERIATAADVINRLRPFAGDNWLESAKEVGAFASTSGVRRRAVGDPNSLQETRPVLEGEDLEFADDESPSQMSQTTDPAATGEEDTLWMSQIRPRLVESGFSLSMLALIAIGLGTVIAVLWAVVGSKL